MREIKASDITQAVAQLFEQANFVLGDDVLSALSKAQDTEEFLSSGVFILSS